MGRRLCIVLRGSVRTIAKRWMETERVSQVPSREDAI
jgi:hypothetical protein